MCVPGHFLRWTKKTEIHWKFVCISLIILLPLHVVRWTLVGSLPRFVVHEKPSKYDESLARIQYLYNRDGEEPCLKWFLEREKVWATTVLPEAWELNYFEVKYNV